VDGRDEATGEGVGREVDVGRRATPPGGDAHALRGRGRAARRSIRTTDVQHLRLMGSPTEKVRDMAEAEEEGRQRDTA
jgi:hypothetical protein